MSIYYFFYIFDIGILNNVFVNYIIMITDKEIVAKILAGDEAAIKDFFFVRCAKALTFIGRHYFSNKYTAEELIGAFYEFMSSDDWHKLRIFKFTCSLNSYIVIIASRYFQRYRDKEMLSLEENILQARNMISDTPSNMFFMSDLKSVLSELVLLDRFLVQRILIDGEKPGDIIDETRQFMDSNKLAYTAAQTDKQFAAYIYTRYSRAKKYVVEHLNALGYR